MPPRIAHLTTVHVWNDTRIFRKQCGGLHQAGYDVTLVAGAERNQVCSNGVRLVALPVYKSRLARMSLGLWNAFRTALKVRADVYHFHDPELIPVGVLLRLLGRRVVYDVHEDYAAQIQTKHWIPRWARRIVGGCVSAIEQAAARVFSGVVSATPGIARKFRGRRAILVQNYPMLDELAFAETAPRAPGTLAYVGVISQPRGIVPLLDAVAKLPEALSPRLVLAGKFVPASLQEELAQHPAWPRVDFRGWCNPRQMAEILAQARVGIVTFLPEPNHVEAQPNKLFDYMAAGLPVVASHFPLWREIVEGTGSGRLVDPASPEEIAAAVEWLLTHPAEADAMGARGTAAVQARFHWGTELARLVALYTELAGPGEVDAPATARRAA